MNQPMAVLSLRFSWPLSKMQLAVTLSWELLNGITYHLLQSAVFSVLFYQCVSLWRPLESPSHGAAVGFTHFSPAMSQEKAVFSSCVFCMRSVSLLFPWVQFSLQILARSQGPTSSLPHIVIILQLDSKSGRGSSAAPHRSAFSQKPKDKYFNSYPCHCVVNL